MPSFLMVSARCFKPDGTVVAKVFAEKVGSFQDAILRHVAPVSLPRAPAGYGLLVGHPDPGTVMPISEVLLIISRPQIEDPWDFAELNLQHGREQAIAQSLQSAVEPMPRPSMPIKKQIEFFVIKSIDAIDERTAD